MKYREYNINWTPLPPCTKPLAYGWVPSKAKMDLMAEGREKELPGYWLYELQFPSKYPGKNRHAGRLCGWLFGKIYAGKSIKI